MNTTPINLERELQGRRRRCSGVAARWCPIHGDCTCRGIQGFDGVAGTYPDLNDETCPLHSSSSDHAELVTAILDAIADAPPPAIVIDNDLITFLYSRKATPDVPADPQPS